ncbi:hypothetical protein PAPYR_9681 [Paratrimastix pyriformis]|uniref:Uncharacterized protein n=1 Tax=Paratrimastix pyriformis TaxID=342808 RepID=A0ABQ8U9G7_9EUKA|nr:hypothetical protein PAPYR_9681 [Paratrimastix pyriformis]
MSTSCDTELSAVKCKICMEPFNLAERYPVTLECCHTLCRQCALELGSEPGVVECPFDRTASKVRLPLGPASFKQNFVMAEVIEELTQDDQVLTERRGGCSRSAQWYCADCNRAMCKDCSDIVHAFVEDHNLVPFAQREEAIFAKPVCLLCKMLEHEDHEVGLLQGVAEQMRARLRDLCALAKTRLAGTNEVLGRSHPGQTVEEAQEKINRIFAEMASLLEARRRTIVDQLQAQAPAKVNEVEAANRKAREQETCLREVIEFAEGLVRQPQSELVEWFPKAEAQLKVLRARRVSRATGVLRVCVCVFVPRRSGRLMRVCVPASVVLVSLVAPIVPEQLSVSVQAAPESLEQLLRTMSGFQIATSNVPSAPVPVSQREWVVSPKKKVAQPQAAPPTPVTPQPKVGAPAPVTGLFAPPLPPPFRRSQWWHPPVRVSAKSTKTADETLLGGFFGEDETRLMQARHHPSPPEHHLVTDEYHSEIVDYLCFYLAEVGSLVPADPAGQHHQCCLTIELTTVMVVSIMPYALLF